MHLVILSNFSCLDLLVTVNSCSRKRFLKLVFYEYIILFEKTTIIHANNNRI